MAHHHKATVQRLVDAPGSWQRLARGRWVAIVDHLASGQGDEAHGEMFALARCTVWDPSLLDLPLGWAHDVVAMYASPASRLDLVIGAVRAGRRLGVTGRDALAVVDRPCEWPSDHGSRMVALGASLSVVATISVRSRRAAATLLADRFGSVSMAA